MKLYSCNTLRAMKQNKAAYLGAVCIIALGILIQVAMTDTLYNLRDKVALYFTDCRFADVFATVEALPETQLDHLAEIPGIDQAFGRLSGDARLLLEGQDEIITLHLLAYSTDDRLNTISLSDNAQEIAANTLYLGTKMQAAYHFTPGQPLQLAVSGRTESLTFAQTANAPEYIYAMPAGAQTPDGAIYDIACLDKAQLELLLDQKGLVTELGFTLKDGYRFADVRTALEEQLSPYGLSALTDRNDQISNYMLRSEFSQLTTMGIVLPAIFLAISVFMLYIVLKKLIDKDRSLIGTMKAFGATDRELLTAYLKQSLALGTVGALLGSVLAIPLGKFMFAMYVDYFNLPYPYYDNFISSRLVGLGIALLTSISATLWGVKDILNITPAESMRPAAPNAAAQPPLSKRLAALLNPRQKMGLRAVWRSKSRSLVIALAIAFPFALTSVLFSFDSVIDQMFYDQFEKVQLYDLKVSLAQYVPYDDAVHAAEQLDGVYHSEAAGELTLLMRHGHLTQYAALMVLGQNSTLYHIMDIKQQYYSPPTDGLIINSKTAADLQLKEGDLVEVTNSQLSPTAVKLPVVRIIEETLGSNCYISQAGLTRCFASPPLANTVMFKVYPQQLDHVKSQLTHTSGILSLTDSARILKGYRELMTSMIAMVNLFTLMAIATGIILITNISVISIRERRSEFGTLAILGADLREISEIVRFEQFLYFGMGLLLGLPLTAGFRVIMEKLVASDTYTVDLQIPAIAYIKALLLCIMIMLAAFIMIMKSIGDIQPADILKERE